MPFSAYVATVDWQQVVALTLVATAAFYLAARTRPRRRFDFKRDTHCGCVSSAQSPSPGSLVFHAHKGKRPEVLVKMR